MVPTIQPIPLYPEARPISSTSSSSLSRPVSQPSDIRSYFKHFGLTSTKETSGRSEMEPMEEGELSEETSLEHDLKIIDNLPSSSQRQT